MDWGHLVAIMDLPVNCSLVPEDSWTLKVGTEEMLPLRAVRAGGVDTLVVGWTKQKSDTMLSEILNSQQ